MVMKELPAEIWSMIAKKVKREPPPAGTKANWNDHFHQQDLVSLLRVSKMLYQVASPILYHTPIVQNLGLFLEGIQHPYDKSRNGIAPYHKFEHFDQVRKLHLIHASSNIPLRPEECVMKLDNSAESGIKVEVWKGNGRQEENTYAADRLGRADLEGWRLARTLVKNCGFAFPKTFRQVESLSFGIWGDGRWSMYKKSQEGSGAGERRRKLDEIKWATSDFAVALDIVFNTGNIRQMVNTCKHEAAGVAWPTQHGLEHSAVDSACPSLEIIHIDDIYLPSPQMLTSTRWYTSIDALAETYSFGQYTSSSFVRLVLHYEDIMRRLHRVADLGEKKTWLELCIASSGEEDQLQGVREVKAALEEWHEKEAETEEYAKATLGKVKILVGDDIPACPVCGSKC